MEIRVKNVGPLQEINLSFDDKVLIVGPNSSGKTILSSLFYFVTSPFNPFVFDPLPPLSNPAIEISKDTVTLDVKKTVREHEETVLRVMLENLAKIIDRRVLSEDFEISTDKYVLRKDKIDIRKDEKIEEKVSLFPADGYALILEIADKILMAGEFDVAKISITGHLLQKYFSTDWNPTVFLGTERVALTPLRHVLYSTLLPPASLRVSEPLIIDPLRWLRPGEYEVLGHKVSFIDSGTGVDIKVSKDGKEIGNQISSGVSQYAIVKAFSTNPIIKSMIIEEPELNLHVDAQIQVAKELSTFEKKLFMTTHSEWMAMTLAYLTNIKVYEIVDGKSEERKVNGKLLEELKTISPYQLKVTEEMLEGEFSRDKA